jgi:agmatinase
MMDPTLPSHPKSSIFGLNDSPKDAQIILLAVPFDATTSYGQGAALGPQAILQASHQIELFDLDVGEPYQKGIAWIDAPEEINQYNTEALGQVALVRQHLAQGQEAPALLEEIDSLCDKINDWLYAEVNTWLAQGKKVAVVGGDHGSVFGCIKAHHEYYPQMGIVHIDAHADLRIAYEGFKWSHASIMHNVLEHCHVQQLTQIGIRDLCPEEMQRINNSPEQIKTFFDKDMQHAIFNGQALRDVFRPIVESLPEQVYVSFDIDGLEPHFAPHTGTPVPGGLSFQAVAYLLSLLEEAGKHIVGFDLNEVAPGPQGDTWDANVAARMLYKLCGYLGKA